MRLGCQGNLEKYTPETLPQGQVVVRKKLPRPTLLPFVAQLAPCRIGMEACQGAHHWARDMNTSPTEKTYLSI